MKDEKVWDYSQCQIGHPCSKCDDICTFKITFRRDNGADEKERKNNERTTKKSKETGQSCPNN